MLLAGCHQKDGWRDHWVLWHFKHKNSDYITPEIV